MSWADPNLMSVTESEPFTNQTNVQLCSSQVDKGKSDNLSENFLAENFLGENFLS